MAGRAGKTSSERGSGALLAARAIDVEQVPLGDRRQLAAFAILGGLAGLVPSLLMAGFTVDDALIPVRYAHHLATGTGYRFNADGPATDGVTPLPWAFVLAPMARGDALVTLAWARAIGVVAWTVAASVLGVGAARLAGARASDQRLGAGGLVVLGLAFPVGAWAASGMETGLATALATVAAALVSLAQGQPRRLSVAAGFAGLAAPLRPELVVWAAVLVAGASLRAPALRDPCASVRRREALRAASSIALSLLPFLGCAVARLVVFGRPAPLAVWAKPSDVAHGAVYAGASLVVLLTPVLALAPFAAWRSRGQTVPILAAFVAHVAVVVAVGGDWMPYARLFVPVAPSLVLVFAEMARAGSLWSSAVRLTLAGALGAWLAFVAAPAGRQVARDREGLIQRARPVLSSRRIVAALDIGWASAATDARIVDLAGLTDPTIAVLGGGHTSKRVSAAMLLDRDVDTVLVYSSPRVVESRLLASPLFREHFEEVQQLPLGPRGAFYAVYRRAR